MHRYQQLANQLKQQIEAQTWRAGEKNTVIESDK
ncbi:hypothetical protein VIBR0546_15421 [Vibrio brasiliensis LMG 20546]|uniref:Uncharacterized protein n=1 Tax=Vibrio brasiliensis LMG 20546 TaxID=945543 RepID=E8LS95_9VIBR|nr:hypothetical protein VIBR0546_15421 [Vibrio brasiliensis LMG 20546]